MASPRSEPRPLLNSVTQHAGTSVCPSTPAHSVESPLALRTHTRLRVDTCSDPVIYKIFYFTVTTDGACYCADAEAPELVWDPSATVRPSCMA